MTPWLAMLLGLAPSVLWLCWVRRGDDHEPEPWRLILVAFVLGAASTGAVWWIAPRWGAWLGAEGVWLEAFAVTAPIEELCKLVVLLPILCWHREVDEPLDGVVYGAAGALGFAAVENALYAHMTGSAMVVAQRTFSATLLHVCCTAGLGFAIATARLGRRRTPRAAALLPFAGLVFAWGVHGFYDALLGRGRAGAVSALLGVLPLALLALTVKMRWARAQSGRFHPAGPPR